MSHGENCSGQRSESAHIPSLLLTLDLQMLFPVDDFRGAQEFLTVLGVLGVDLVTIGVVIEIICHLLLLSGEGEYSFYFMIWECFFF